MARVQVRGHPTGVEAVSESEPEVGEIARTVGRTDRRQLERFLEGPDRRIEVGRHPTGFEAAPQPNADVLEKSRPLRRVRRRALERLLEGGDRGIAVGGRRAMGKPSEQGISQVAEVGRTPDGIGRNGRDCRLEGGDRFVDVGRRTARHSTQMKGQAQRMEDDCAERRWCRIERLVPGDRLPGGNRGVPFPPRPASGGRGALVRRDRLVPHLLQLGWNGHDATAASRLRPLPRRLPRARVSSLPFALEGGCSD